MVCIIGGGGGGGGGVKVERTRDGERNKETGERNDVADEAGILPDRDKLRKKDNNKVI